MPVLREKWASLVCAGVVALYQAWVLVRYRSEKYIVQIGKTLKFIEEYSDVISFLKLHVNVKEKDKTPYLVFIREKGQYQFLTDDINLEE